MCPVQTVTHVSGRSLKSNTCSHFQNNFVFNFRSIRSNNGLFRRKLEAQTSTLCHFFAKLHVVFCLVVQIGHILSGIPSVSLAN